MVASSPHSHMCSQSTLLSIPIFSRQFLALKGDWRLHTGDSQMAQWYRICLPMQKIQVQSLGWEDPLEGNGNPLQYSCLENYMDRGAWQASVHGVATGRTCLSMHSWRHHVAAEVLCCMNT